MPHPPRDPQHRNTRAQELQVQRERLRQRFLGGATLEEAADLMQAMHALLPKSKLSWGKAAPSWGDIELKAAFSLREPPHRLALTEGSDSLYAYNIRLDLETTT